MTLTDPTTIQEAHFYERLIALEEAVGLWPALPSEELAFRAARLRSDFAAKSADEEADDAVDVAAYREDFWFWNELIAVEKILGLHPALPDAA